MVKVSRIIKWYFVVASYLPGPLIDTYLFNYIIVSGALFSDTTVSENAAGKGCAYFTKWRFSFIRNAVYMACEVYKKRSEYKELTKNPLKASAKQRE